MASIRETKSSERRFVSLKPAELIRRLDRKIEAARRELRRREKIDPMSYISWGEAWDKHRELKRRHCNLFWLRGEFQVQHNILEEQRARREARTARVKKPKPCKTCGGSGFAKAA